MTSQEFVAKAGELAARVDELRGSVEKVAALRALGDLWHEHGTSVPGTSQQFADKIAQIWYDAADLRAAEKG